MPRMLLSETVNGRNVTDSDAFGPTVVDRESIWWPSISSVTGTV